MLIRNFGHLWERRFTFWGRGGVKGHLNGRRTPKDRPVNFRDQIAIYVLFDKDRTPVYVGQTGKGDQRLFKRLRQHQRDHLWNRWHYFSWFGFRRVNDKSRKLSEFDRPEKVFKASGESLLNEIEGALLVALEPSKNKLGPLWSDVDEYLQDIEEELEDRSIGEALEQLESLQKAVTSLLKRT